MKAAFITVALVALAVPVLADGPDVETYAAPLDAQSDPTQIRVKTPLQQAIADIQDRAIKQVQILHAQLLSRAPGSAEAREMLVAFCTAARILLWSLDAQLTNCTEPVSPPPPPPPPPPPWHCG